MCICIILRRIWCLAFSSSLFYYFVTQFWRVLEEKFYFPDRDESVTTPRREISFIFFIFYFFGVRSRVHFIRFRYQYYRLLSISLLYY